MRAAPSTALTDIARRGYGYFVITIRGNTSNFIGPCLLFLGMFLMTVAIVVPLALVPRLKVVPLDLDITTVATSNPAGLTSNDEVPARVFDRCSVNEPKLRVFDAHLTQQRRTVAIDPSDQDQVTLQSAQTVVIDRVRDDAEIVAVDLGEQDAKRPCGDGLLASSVDIVSLDRRTSKPNGQLNQLHTVPIPSGVPVMESPSTWVDAPREGFQYHFGFEVERRGTYPYYDVNSRSDQPARYVGETTINGLSALEFVSEVPEVDQTQLATPSGLPALGSSIEMPAKWWGISRPGVDPEQKVLMHRYGKATRRVWVEPQTGTVLYGSEVQHQYFKAPEWDYPVLTKPIQDFRVDALNMTMSWTDATVEQQTNRARDYIGQLRIGNIIVPWTAGIVGAVLAGVGVFLTFRTARRSS